MKDETAFKTLVRIIGEDATLTICEAFDAEKVSMSRKNIERIRTLVGDEAAALVWFRFQGERVSLPTATGVKKIRAERERLARLERYRRAALKDATAAFLEGIARESVVRAAARSVKEKR